MLKKINYLKAFRKFKSSVAKILLKAENIIDVRDMIMTSANDHSESGRMLLHLLEGKRGAKQFTGIHYLTYPLPKWVVNFLVIQQPDRHGVYVATFEIHEENGKILKKENTSTLFPSDWSRQRVYDECLYALEEIVMVENVRSYQSRTFSGIPVEVHFDETRKKIRTLYPIRTLE